MQLGQLLGEFKGLHKRFDTVETDLRNGVDTLHKRISDHEEREEPRLQRIERMIWIGVGGVIILSALLPLGLSVIQRAVAQVIG
jgi:hypothetical protein